MYCGVFNFAHERYIQYAHACSCKQAWLLMCKQIAKKQDVSPKMVMNYFNGEKDNFKIEIETAFFEAESE